MHAQMLYDGRRLQWMGHGIFRATSGLPDFQEAIYQCFVDKGPIPEGSYSVAIREDEHPAHDDGTDSCTLAPAPRLQAIPRGADAGACEPFWVNWGRNRVALTPMDRITKLKCNPRRGGFYLHDSTKGYTHGCIEVEGRFFEVLRSFIRGMKAHRVPRVSSLTLIVRYLPGQSTNGGTAAP